MATIPIFSSIMSYAGLHRRGWGFNKNVSRYDIPFVISKIVLECSLSVFFMCSLMWQNKTPLDWGTLHCRSSTLQLLKMMTLLFPPLSQLSSHLSVRTICCPCPLTPTAERVNTWLKVNYHMTYLCSPSICALMHTRRANLQSPCRTWPCIHKL